MFGTFFIITQYLQLVLGYSPLEAGIRVLPWAAVYMVSTTRSAGLVERSVNDASSPPAWRSSLASWCSPAAHRRRYYAIVRRVWCHAGGMGIHRASTGAIMQSCRCPKPASVPR